LQEDLFQEASLGVKICSNDHAKRFKSRKQVKQIQNVFFSTFRKEENFTKQIGKKNLQKKPQEAKKHLQLYQKKDYSGSPSKTKVILTIKQDS